MASSPGSKLWFTPKITLAQANLYFAERTLKFLLWQRGRSKVYVGGPPSIGAYFKSCYAPGGNTGV